MSTALKCAFGALKGLKAAKSALEELYEARDTGFDVVSPLRVDLENVEGLLERFVDDIMPKAKEELEESVAVLRSRLATL